jgi:hypothetical protein
MVNEYQPKKSYWYVSTLKNVLGETVFVGENGDNYATSYDKPRVLRFQGSVPGFQSANLTVYAIWTPTQNNESYKRTGNNIFEISAMGETAATMIKMEPNDANGIRSSLTVINGMVQIPAEDVNERPIYVVLGEAIDDPALSCVNFISTQPAPGSSAYSHAVSCDAIKVVWEVPPGQTFDHYLVYYYDRKDSETPAPLMFDIGDPYWKLYEENLPGNCTQVVIGGLTRPFDEVQVAVIGVNVDGVNTPACLASVRTATCEGPVVVDKSNFTTDVSTACTDLLFDLSSVNFCSAEPANITTLWNFYGGDCAGEDEITLTFNQPYHIDLIRFLDGNDVGNLEVYYDTDQNDPFDNSTPLIYNTLYFDEWKSLVFPACSSSIKRLKFKLNSGYSSLVRKIAIYGEPQSGELPLECCGTSSALVVTDQNASAVQGLNTAQEIVVNGTLTIDGAGFTFGQPGGTGGPTFFMMPGSKIRVNADALLTIQGNSSLQGCDQMWQGIEILPWGKVVFDESQIQDAYKAFRVLRTTTQS